MGSSWFVDIFCPSLGTLICFVMWLSPLRAILEARKKQDLGTLNPFPYFVIIFNCIAWSMYGCMMRDHFIFWSNWTGLTIGSFYALTSFALLAKQQTQPKVLEQCEWFFIFTVAFWGLMGMVAGIIYGPSEYDRLQANILIGTLSSFASICYYGSPLSTLYEVIKKKDSSSLYLPLTICSLANATMWTIYGLFAKGDINIWLPNVIGILLGVIQLFLIMIFPAHEIAKDHSSKFPPSSSEFEFESPRYDLTISSPTPPPYTSSLFFGLTLLCSFFPP